MGKQRCRRPQLSDEIARPEACRSGRGRSRGQALTEFTLIVPVMFLVIAGIVQYGLYFWSQQTLTQIARDTGRWAATQTYCDSNTSLIAQTANDIAENSTLFGYSTDLWTDGGAGTNKVAVTWPRESGEPCPPASNQDEAWVQVEIDHQIPVFFPLVPGDGRLTSTAQFRMEPEPV